MTPAITGPRRLIVHFENSTASRLRVHCIGICHVNTYSAPIKGSNRPNVVVDRIAGSVGRVLQRFVLLRIVLAGVSVFCARLVFQLGMSEVGNPWMSRRTSAITQSRRVILHCQKPKLRDLGGFDCSSFFREFVMEGPSEGLRNAAELEDGKCVSVGGLAVECGVYCAPDPRTRIQKLRDRLFPARHCFAPEAPSEFKDCIHGHAVTKLSWTDRFRVLLTGVVVTSWRTVTENEVGQTVSAATCHIGTAKDLTR